MRTARTHPPQKKSWKQPTLYETVPLSVYLHGTPQISVGGEMKQNKLQNFLWEVRYLQTIQTRSPSILDRLICGQSHNKINVWKTYSLCLTLTKWNSLCASPLLFIYKWCFLKFQRKHGTLNPRFTTKDDIKYTLFSPVW